MTCCFQGRYHGNTEEDSKLDSASQRRKSAVGGHRAKEGRVGAADIILLLITAKWRGSPMAEESHGLVLKSSVV